MTWYDREGPLDTVEFARTRSDFLRELVDRIGSASIEQFSASITARTHKFHDAESWTSASICRDLITKPRSRHVGPVLLMFRAGESYHVVVKRSDQVLEEVVLGTDALKDVISDALEATSWRTHVTYPSSSPSITVRSSVASSWRAAIPSGESARHIGGQSDSTAKDRLRQIRALAELQELQKARAVVQAAEEGLTQREIAGLLGTSQSNVHRLLRQARAAAEVNQVRPREVILAYAAGAIPREALLTRLSGLIRGHHEDRYDDGYEPGTWDEVRDAYLDGLLDEYDYSRLRRDIVQDASDTSADLERDAGDGQQPGQPGFGASQRGAV